MRCQAWVGICNGKSTFNESVAEGGTKKLIRTHTRLDVVSCGKISTGLTPLSEYAYCSPSKLRRSNANPNPDPPGPDRGSIYPYAEEFVGLYTSLYKAALERRRNPIYVEVMAEHTSERQTCLIRTLFNPGTVLYKLLTDSSRRLAMAPITLPLYLNLLIAYLAPPTTRTAPATTTTPYPSQTPPPFLQPRKNDSPKNTFSHFSASNPIRPFHPCPQKPNSDSSSRKLSPTSSTATSTTSSQRPDPPRPRSSLFSSPPHAHPSYSLHHSPTSSSSLYPYPHHNLSHPSHPSHPPPPSTTTTTATSSFSLPSSPNAPPKSGAYPQQHPHPHPLLSQILATTLSILTTAEMESTCSAESYFWILTVDMCTKRMMFPDLIFLLSRILWVWDRLGKEMGRDVMHGLRGRVERAFLEFLGLDIWKGGTGSHGAYRENRSKERDGRLHEHDKEEGRTEETRRQGQEQRYWNNPRNDFRPGEEPPERPWTGISGNEWMTPEEVRTEVFTCLGIWEML
jgi:hypothetical protein